MRHLDFLEDIRAGIESRSFKTDTRELSRQLTLELDRYPDTRTDNGLRRKLMLYYLGEIKKEEDSLGKDLGKNGIAKCIKTLNPRGLTRHANLKLEKKVRI